jgi:hypothetical protein
MSKKIEGLGNNLQCVVEERSRLSLCNRIMIDQLLIGRPLLLKLLKRGSVIDRFAELRIMNVDAHALQSSPPLWRDSYRKAGCWPAPLQMSQPGS